MNQVIVCFCFLVLTSVSVTHVAKASITWTASNGQLFRNGVPISLKGFSVTCMEYLLSGIGAECLADYKGFANFSEIITSLNQQEMNSVYSILLPPPNIHAQPTIRLQLNAGYFLDVETPLWAPNRALFPNLSAQYRKLIDLIVKDATSKNIVVILDLHWNDDVNPFSEMALKGGSASPISGDSLTFWNTIAPLYADNPLVFYDLFNAPHINNFTQYMEGDDTFEGMRAMTNAVLSKNPKGMIIVAGQKNFAYDAESLKTYAEQIGDVSKVLFAFQPFLGVPDGPGGDAAKSIPGYIEQVDDVLSVTKRPIFLSNLGQFCCENDGPCDTHPGVHEGLPMGYVKALLFETTKRNISWVGFGYRPGVGGRCDQPDVNDGGVLYNSQSHNNQGADWSSLFPVFFKGDLDAVLNPPTNSPTEADDQGADEISIAVPIVSGIGGGLVIIGALGIFFRRQHQKTNEKMKRLEAELAKWSPSEERALKEKWMTTHDFEELCSVVPHRSRESVAWKAKSFQKKPRSMFITQFARTASYVPSERFAFISPRLPNRIPKWSFRPPTREATQASRYSPTPFSSSASMNQQTFVQANSPYQSFNPAYNSLRTTVSY